MLLAWGCMSLPSRADNYPETTVRIVVPFPAGAAADAATRVLAKKLGDYWGKMVIVDNKAGAHGMQAVATAPADGLTLLLGAGSGIVTAPLMNPKLPYNPQKDFAPVGRVVINPPLLLVNPSLGVKSLKELVAAAKARPGKIFFASSGMGSPNHLAMEMFMQATGVEMVHVPYKGGSQPVVDLLGGVVQVGMNVIPSVLPHVKAGKLVPLAIASSRRSPMLPELPTTAEAGFPNMEFDGWYGVFAPAATPAAIIKKISTDMQRALREPDVAAALLAQGAEAAPSSAQELASFVANDIARWSRLIRERNLKLE